jgi:tetratricopeptide (TPR) repeat protein
MALARAGLFFVSFPQGRSGAVVAPLRLACLILDEAGNQNRDFGAALLGFSLLLWLLPVGVMDPARAGQLYTEAIAAAERSGDQLRTSVLHNNAGVRALRTGDLTAAQAHLDQAAEAMRAIGQKSHHAALNQGWLLREENDTEGARPMFETALRISRRNGDRPGLAYAILGLACLAADHGDWPRAATLQPQTRMVGFDRSDR